MTEQIPADGETPDAFEADIQANLRLLLRELCDFANRDARFRSGQADYTAIEVMTGDQTLPGWQVDLDESDIYDEADDDPDEAENDSGFQAPSADFTYRFAAERKRYIDDSARQRAWVKFTFMVIGRLQNLQAPLHIAEDSMGLPAAEAVKELGMVTLCREAQYTFCTQDLSFAVCESLTWLDGDDDPISEACTCDDQGMIYVTNAATIEEVGNLLSVEAEGTIKQYAPQPTEERAAHESLVVEDVNEAVLEEWATSDSLGHALDQEFRLAQITSARAVLANINEAIFAKLGLVKPPVA